MVTVTCNVAFDRIMVFLKVLATGEQVLESLVKDSPTNTASEGFLSTVIDTYMYVATVGGIFLGALVCIYKFGLHLVLFFL